MTACRRLRGVRACVFARPLDPPLCVVARADDRDERVAAEPRAAEELTHEAGAVADRLDRAEAARRAQVVGHEPRALLHPALDPARERLCSCKKSEEGQRGHFLGERVGKTFALAFS